MAVTKKALKKAAKAIRKGNAKFQRMSKAEKRVAIAKDALNMLNSGKFRGRSGKYHDFFYMGEATDSGQSLQEALKGVETCQVCARGALFLSGVRKFNRCSIGEMPCQDRDRFDPIETRYFTQTQLALIEDWYEGGEGYAYDETFLDAFPDDHERLKFILKNIIKNNGTFVPPVRTVTWE